MGIHKLGVVLTLDELTADEQGQKITGMEKQNDRPQVRDLEDHPWVRILESGTETDVLVVW